LAELHDKQLFEQPDGSHVGECPICCLPLPNDPHKSTLKKKHTMMGCCSKAICLGCDVANQKREREQGLEHRCAFCREPAPKSDEESQKQVMERVKKNDPAAMCFMAKKHYEEGDYDKAFEYFTKAAGLGDVEANYCLGGMHYNGNGMEKDEKKAIHHTELAAIGGHTLARGYLAATEVQNGRMERGVKHFIINAKLGHDISLQQVKQFFIRGIVTKDEYADALRGYQAAVDATKSAEREEGEAFYAFAYSKIDEGHSN
jgi:tetratricopeptide (TPR) repeat protein